MGNFYFDNFKVNNFPIFHGVGVLLELGTNHSLLFFELNLKMICIENRFKAITIMKAV